MFNMDSKKLISVLLGLVILGGFGIGGYRYYQLTQKEPAQPPIKDEEEKIYEIVDGEIYPEWKKLINYVGGYSIEYPPEGDPGVAGMGEITSIRFNVPWGTVGMSLRVFANPNELSPRGWAEEEGFRKKHRVLREEGAAVGDVKAYSFVVYSPIGEYQYTYFSVDKQIIEMGFNHKAGLGEDEDTRLKGRFLRMLNTFNVLN